MIIDGTVTKSMLPRLTADGGVPLSERSKNPREMQTVDAGREMATLDEK